MASSSDDQPSQPTSEESLNERQINGLIGYFDRIKTSLSDNGDVSGAILKPNPPKPLLPPPAQDSAASVPFCVGLCVSGMANPDIGSCAPNKSSHDSNDRNRLLAQAEKLQRELLDVRRELSNFRKLNDDVASSYRDFASGRIDLQTVPDEAQLEGRFRLVTDMVQSLKHRVKAAEEPFALTFEPYYLVFDKNQGTNMRTRVQNTSCYRDHLDNNLRGMFDKLHNGSSECLMCFSVFPENAVLRKSFLKNWWIGEGLFNNDEDGRKEIDKVLNLLLEKGFIEPFLKKRRLAGFKVDPLVRFFLIKIAEEREFSRFDPMGWPSDVISPSQRAFLVKHGEDYSRIALVKDVPHQDLGKLKTLFNVNDSYPDFKEDWFSKLRNLEVLSLGGLHGLVGQDIRAEDENMNNRKFKGPRGKRGLLRQHIEVEDTQFLRGMKNMKKLKFLGLQGISRLMNIPESIGNLSGLAILDLCACHNLESLPNAFEKLKNLTHLDVSECYLLDHIPKGVKNLSKLEVLKGFLVGSSTSAESCTLSDLKSLTRLRKISIYTNNRKFPDNKDLEVLKGFKTLQNLAIVWGGKSVEILDKAVQNDLGSVVDSNPVTDSAPASIPPCKEDNGMEKIPEDGEIEGTKQSLAPVTPPVPAEAMKKKSKSFKRILSGKNPEDSVRMRNADNNSKPSDIPDVAAPMQEVQTDGNASLQRADTPGIRKLELQCYPGTEMPVWVVEGKLKPQKKLYIGGGNLRSLGRGDPKWTISILRLKFLRDLEMDWTGLKKSFPKLIYLEKVRCPKLSFFPCDNTGVWWKRDIKEEELDALGLGLPWTFLKRKAC